jgi:hypothetical protein
MKLKHSIVEIPDAATNAGGNSKISVKYNVEKIYFSKLGTKENSRRSFRNWQLHSNS